MEFMDYITLRVEHEEVMKMIDGCVEPSIDIPGAETINIEKIKGIISGMNKDELTDLLLIYATEYLTIK